MMKCIKLLDKIPNQSIIAISGGVDSMTCHHFLTQNPNRSVVPAYFNHRTEHSSKAEEFLRSVFSDRLVVGSLSEDCPSECSLEEHWRNQRYSFLDTLSKHLQLPVIVCHHLDDVVETWVWSSLHGTPKIIPYQRNMHTIRPFLLTPKKLLISWAERKGVSWIEDISNDNTRFIRNYVRHELLPHAYRVNPGLRKVVARKVVEEFKNSKCNV